jgi:hypothetical protein
MNVSQWWLEFEGSIGLEYTHNKWTPKEIYTRMQQLASLKSDGISLEIILNILRDLPSSVTATGMSILGECLMLVPRGKFWRRPISKLYLSFDRLFSLTSSMPR